jgi:hypothetical protein
MGWLKHSITKFIGLLREKNRRAQMLLGTAGTYYAHLDAYAPGLVVGNHVTPETVLGYVGTTGNAAGALPHLHFGVYTTAGAIDPLPLLSNRD